MQDEMDCNLPEREEILDLLLARSGADVLDVDGVCRHIVGCFCVDLDLICDFGITKSIEVVDWKSARVFAFVVVMWNVWVGRCQRR